MRGRSRPRERRNVIVNQKPRPPRPQQTSTTTLAVLGGLVLLGIIGVSLGRSSPAAPDKPQQAQEAPPTSSSEARRPDPPRPAPQPPPPKATADNSPTFPAHVIADDSSLAPKRGRRIEVRVGEVISAADCARLVQKYRDRAGAEGQVSVSVQVVTPKGEKSVAPLCVDNLDGQGAQDGIGRQLIQATKASAVPLPK